MSVGTIDGWRAPVTTAADLETWRCSHCGRILAKVWLIEGSVIEVKCHSCNALSTIDLRRCRTLAAMPNL